MTSPLHPLRRFALKHRIFRLLKTRTFSAYVRRLAKGNLPPRQARRVPADEKIRLGLIGVGKHARQVLLPVLSHVADFELAAMCVRTRRSRAELEEKFSVPCVLHYEEVLTRDDLDAVIVATPSALHRYLVMDAIRCGKHVMCEAPGIVSELDIAQVDAAMAGTQTIVQYGHRFWYAPIYSALAEALRTFGAPGARTLRFIYPEALHLYGIALMLNGPIAVVEAQGVEHNCTYDVEFVNGDKAVFQPLPEEPDPGKMSERVELSWNGEKLVAEGGMRLKRRSAAGEEDEMGRFDFDPAYAQDHTKMADGSNAAREALRQRGYIPELESFAQCIRSGEPPRVGLEQAGAVFRLVWAMFESVGTGRRIEIEV